MKYLGKTLITLLGPTASGKTALAVQLAQQIHGAIVSADSRQIFKGMDIGTGKDLSEYSQIPYFGIDIIPPGTPYHVAQFREDAVNYLKQIQALNRWPIICGGTGLYLQALLQGLPYSDVPVNPLLRLELEDLDDDALRLRAQNTTLPPDFKADWSTRKRSIRAIEIGEWLQYNPFKASQKSFPFIAFGLQPDLENRRKRIRQRLEQRIDQGLISEVQTLLQQGLTDEQLIFYGLEYKYTTFYLRGMLSFDAYLTKLTTEIQRYAKRQMTFFRKLEKDGIPIIWLKNESTQGRLAEIIHYLSTQPAFQPYLPLDLP